MNDKISCEIIEMKLPVVYGVINADGELLKANTRWVKMFESKLPMLPKHQPNGQTTRDFILQKMDEASRMGESNFEIYVNKKDKSLICIAVNLQSEADGTFTICAHDITHYKTSLENALKREQENEKKALDLARRFLDAAPVFLEIWDNERNLAGANQTAVKLFRLRDTDHFIEVYDKLHPEYQPCGMKTTEKIPLVIEEVMKNGSFEGEWMHVDLDGNSIPVQYSYTRFDVGNDEYCIVGYSQDLRPIQAAMSEMENALKTTRELIDSAPFFVEVWNKNNELVDCSQVVVKTFGVSSKEEYISKFHKLSPEYQPCGQLSDEVIKETVSQAFEEGYARHEWMHLDKDGNLWPFDCIYVRMRRLDEDIVVAYASDLRPIRKAEDANRAKSSFLSIISHEIRTPLNAILGITHIRLQKNSLTFEDSEAYRKIYSSGSTLLGIINGMLDLSKIETGNLELVPVEYDMPNLINDVVQLNFVQLESKPVEFLLEIDENLPSTLFGDDLRIKQILNNLLSNSVKYTLSGYIKFSVRSASSDETCELKFVIEDTGQGIRSEDLPKLFLAYTRFNLEDNRTIEGTGIGLKITEELVKMMGGRISVESSIGVGSKFVVTILQKTTGSNPIGKKLAKELENLSFTDSKLKTLVAYESMPYGSALIVDDVESNLYVAEGLLAPYNITIDLVESGFDALEKIKSGKVYDVIFMDHMMPKMDGIQTTKKLREMGYTGVIIALTANALKGSDDFFLSNGFDWFISKPIDVRQLDSAMTRFIRDKHLEKATRTETIIPAIKKEKTSKKKIGNRLLIAVLRDVNKAIHSFKDFQKTGDMEQLIFAAHSVKSALLNINEKELSDIAASLEKAGLSHNMEYIDSYLGNFLQNLEKLLSDIDRYLISRST